MDRTTLTVVFQIKDMDQAKALWESHKTGKPVLGMIPSKLHWGDVVEKLDKAEEILWLLADGNCNECAKLADRAEEVLKL
jgi:hypothetical protein